jgi:serine/threonine protein kinase/class 3 adenylate cyclase
MADWQIPPSPMSHCSIFRLVAATDFCTLMLVAGRDLPQIAIERRGKVEAFQRKHRVGLLTLLFTDIVDSTKLKHTLGDREAVPIIQRHHAVIREILGQFDEGEEIETAGDSFFIVFTKPSDAVKFALLVQARLRALAAEVSRSVMDRIGIHVGEVWVEEHQGSGKAKDLYGLQVDTCARVQSLAQADQILLTRFPFDAARQALRGEELQEIRALSWLNHGPYLMKGLEEPLEICEVGELGQAKLMQPPASEKARRFVPANNEPVLGWRPAIAQSVPGTSWVLEKKLGEEGFGEVWLGRDKRLKTEHVFKFCFRADQVRSLKREVTLFRLLKERFGDHPNIVGIKHVYFDEAPFYIVMEHVEGQDLATWCKGQGGVEKVPLGARIEIVAQIADALQAAHDSGVIHRDVKPSNILVGGRNNIRAYLTNFGIGKIISDEVLSRLTQSMADSFTRSVTNSFLRSGTQLYMAPELFADQAASTRSDIYALGVMLYQMVVGDFSRAVTADWAKKEVIDPLLREDLEKCVAVDPGERFAQAGQLAERLRCLEERRLISRNALLKEQVRTETPGEHAKSWPRFEPAGTEEFANYHILKHSDGTLFRLGQGARGVTYKAFDTSLDRLVALKVIDAALLGSDEARRRFVREARSVAKIQHPHVAAIHHVGQQGEDYFYTLEWVDGEDIERLVQARGPLSPAAGLRVILQVAGALEAARVHQLIHREIKPSHIIARVNRTGKLDVKLIDFGLAKGPGSGGQELSLLSQTRSFVGSLAFASPEQCEMGDIDTRSDIYSLGATLWYLLTGKPPFAGNVNQVMIAHVVKPPPFERLQGAPEAVVGLLRQMLAKSPEGRPKDPQALREAIEAIEPHCLV